MIAHHGPRADSPVSERRDRMDEYDYLGPRFSIRSIKARSSYPVSASSRLSASYAAIFITKYLSLKWGMYTHIRVRTICRFHNLCGVRNRSRATNTSVVVFSYRIVREIYFRVVCRCGSMLVIYTTMYIEMNLQFHL